MKYLIDTHILIWLAISPEKISKDVLSVLENPLNVIFVSTVSFWEIAIKLSIGKLNLQGMEIEIKQKLIAVMQQENELLDVILEQQTILHECVTEKNWMHLESCMVQLQVLSDRFVELNQVM